MVGLSRRRFLGAAGALAGGLLAACGRDEARRRPPSDADVARGLLRSELRAWEAARRAPDGAVLARQDREHIARLSAIGGVEILNLEGSPGSALAAKQQALFAYVDALPRLEDPELRELVMRIAASEAGHLAALRLAAGDEPVPDAFAGYTEAVA